MSRKMRTKLAKLYAVNRMFRMPVIIHGPANIDNMCSENKFSKIHSLNVDNEINNSDYILNLNVNEKSQLLSKPMSSNRITCFKTKVNRNQKRTMKRKLNSRQLELLKLEGNKWHRRMGHIPSDYVHKLKFVADNIPDMISTANIETCEICAWAKQIRKSFTKDRERATRVGEIVHADTVGPVSPPTFVEKKRFFLSVIDDYSRFLQVFVIKHKTEISECLNEAYRFIRAKYPAPGQFNLFRSDNGTEFTSSDTISVLNKFDVKPQYSEPFCSEHNGLVERVQKTIQERSRSILGESGFPVRMWGLAVEAACWLYNRTPHSALDFQTPFEKFYGKRPNLLQIKMFGSRVQVLDEKLPTGRKFDFRTNKKYLVGFTETGYTVFDPITRKIEAVCNVTINEDHQFKDDYPPPDTNRKLVLELFEESDISSGGGLSKNGGGSPSGVKVTEENVTHSRNENMSEIRNENENLIPLDVIDEDDSPTSPSSEISIELDEDWSDHEEIVVKKCYIGTHDNKLRNFGEFDKNWFCDTPVPLTYKQATTGENSEKWLAAIKVELDAIERHDVWDIVPREKGIKSVPVKWVFTIKSNGKYKARLVAVGCRDTEKYSKIETASPTPSPSTIRWFFAIVVHMKWTLVQLDITNAFLHGHIDREKYVSVPLGIVPAVDSRKFMCKLKKALYGLATAPLCFNKILNEKLIELGFSRNEREPCVYTKKNETTTTLLLVFVDDILITGCSPNVIENVIDELGKSFELKNMGYPKMFVGIEIEERNNNLFLHQNTHAKAVIEKFLSSDKTDGKSPSFPMPPLSQQNHISIPKVTTFPFRQAIGALMYLANSTRLDITFAVHYLARFQSDPQPLHWALVQRILNYLKNTSDYGLTYKSYCTSNTLEAFVDADHAGDRTRKSTTGFVIRLFGSTVTWCSRLQRCITENTCEVEFVALGEAAHDVLFLAHLTKETLGIDLFPATLFEDDYAALQQSHKTVGRGRLKHVELRQLKIREYVQNNLLKVIQVGTENQLADILTKPLFSGPFVKCRNELMTSHESLMN